MANILEFHEISKIIVKACLDDKQVEIYYPRTENTPEGWREIKPYNITTDIPPEGEELVIGKDRFGPGHILNAYTVNGKDREIRSFIIGKIKSIREN